MPAMLKRPAAATTAFAAKKLKQGKPMGQPSTKEVVGTKSLKQTQDSAGTKPVKKTRDPSIAKVAAGFALAADVPDAAKLMLDSVLEDSLGTPKGERHPYQATMVDVIENTFGTIEKGLQASLDGVLESIARNDATKASAASAVEESQTKLEDQKSEVCKRKYDLAGVATAFKAAREVVSEVKLGQEEAERSLKKAAGDKQQLEMALADYFQPLLTEGSTSGDTMGEEKADNLVRILRRFSFDESMMSALPTALLKEPGARGSFDAMVLSQLQAEAAKRIADIDATLAEAAPAKAERAANLERAEVEFKEAKAKQLDSARVFQEARAEEERRQVAVQEAKKAVSEASKEARRLQKEADKCQRVLDSFREGPQAAFLQLRDRSAPAPPAVEEETQALATEVVDMEAAAVAAGGAEETTPAEQETVTATAE